MCTYVYVPHIFGCLWRPEEGDRLLRAGITGGCWGLDLKLLQEQQVPYPRNHLSRPNAHSSVLSIPAPFTTRGPKPWGTLLQSENPLHFWVFHLLFYAVRRHHDQSNSNLKKKSFNWGLAYYSLRRLVHDQLWLEQSLEAHTVFQVAGAERV